MSVATQLRTCMSPDATYNQFRPWSELDQDTTEGRYADVSVTQCLTCDRLWLSYRLEYEGFSRSGRWARGEIDAYMASTMRPEGAPSYLAALPTHLYGGSYFGRSGRRSGRMSWGV